MEQAQQTAFLRAIGGEQTGSRWRLSWSLLVGAYVFLITLYNGHFMGLMLSDGDTYWHVATGRWILDHGVIPLQDPFSNSMRGQPWVAKEWISQLIFARAHDVGGWGGVVAVTGAAFATAFVILNRALLRVLPPMRALLFTAMAVLMAVSHLLARPYILAMPLMMLWMVELFAAADEQRVPRLRLLPVMVLWANMHGGFTIGLAFAVVVAIEGMVSVWSTDQRWAKARAWSLFLTLALASALLTPQGPRGLWFTWQVMAEDTYALSRISEWASPNFHDYQPLQFWLLGCLALAFHQGLRLPVVRLVLLLGLLNLALKHVRNVELLGMIGPLIVAKPLADQWRMTAMAADRLRKDDVILQRLAHPASRGASIACFLILIGVSALLQHIRPVQLPELTMPVRALDAVRTHVSGRVLNDYGWGGALIYVGIPPFIDSRQDLYRDAFMRRQLEAIELKDGGNGLRDLLEQYRIGWTMLRPGTPAIALFDVMPGWKRLYADSFTVVHVREQISRGELNPRP